MTFRRKNRLDVNSPRGQETLKEEKRAYEIFTQRFPIYMISETPKKGKAGVDGILNIRTKIKGVLETKCRKMTLEELRGRFENKWLLTYEKLLKCAKVSELLDVPAYGFLYLTPEDRLLVIQLTDRDGNILPDYHTDFTYTQKTVNGGLIKRENAYINMKTAREVRPKNNDISVPFFDENGNILEEKNEISNHDI